MMKKLLSTVLAFTLLLVSVPAAQADQAAIIEQWDCGATPGSVTATLYEGGTLVVTGTGPMRDYMKITSMDVFNTSYAKYGEPGWTKYRGAISEIVISDGITYISGGAFRNLSSSDQEVTTLKIADTVVGIGDIAFSNSLNTDVVDIPDSVQTIGKRAFDYCRIREFRLGAGLQEIGECAFARSEAKGATLQVSPLNKQFSVENGETLVENGETLVYRVPQDTKGTYIVPSGIKTIGAYAFRDDNSLKTVVLPNGVQNVERGAFAYSSIKELYLPTTIASLASRSVIDDPLMRTSAVVHFAGGQSEWNMVDAKGWDVDYSSSYQRNATPYMEEAVDAALSSWFVPNSLTADLPGPATRRGTAYILAQALRLTDWNGESPFVDVDDPYVSVLAWAGIVTGVGDRQFAPNALLTRAELATMLHRILSDAPNAETSFADVPASAWYAPHVAAVAAAGIMLGIGDGMFNPNGVVTVEQVIVACNRLH